MVNSRTQPPILMSRTRRPLVEFGNPLEAECLPQLGNNRLEPRHGGAFASPTIMLCWPHSVFTDTPFNPTHSKPPRLH